VNRLDDLSKHVDVEPAHAIALDDGRPDQQAVCEARELALVDAQDPAGGRQSDQIRRGGLPTSSRVAPSFQVVGHE
jgi:hypothetical protein